MGGFFRSNASLIGVIRNLKSQALPIGMLEHIQRNYSVRAAGSSGAHIKPYLNIMYLL